MGERHVQERLFLFGKYIKKGTIGAEIGVRKGDFSEAIVHYLNPKELHLIDPWERNVEPRYATGGYGQKDADKQFEEFYQSVLGRFSMEIELEQVILHRGKSDAIVPSFFDNYFDWMYIDGDHFYDAVILDLQMCYEKTKQGGLLICDDYGFSGWWNDGVTKVVREYAKSNIIELLKIQNGQAIFRKS